MYIKEVLNYDYNYAEYIVTDGEYNLICICGSVPLPESKEPKKGMNVAEIIVFAPDGMNATRIEGDENKRHLIKKGKHPLSYYLQAEIVDRERHLVRIGGLIIETERLPTDYKNGEFIGFEVDRLDCYLDV